ncbi:MAG: Iron-containing alcohol dehydrogenase [Candidatus Hydrogenedentes bacterium]|nr:Iron-containing alcohol dehydrogenase [Candidatus Hydrogenedentota bacterium]
MTTKLGWHSLGTTFDCPCGETHRLPIEVCHVGEDAALRLAEFARQRCGTSCLIVSDENTRRAGGEALLSALSAAGIHVSEQVYGTAPLEATETRAKEVAQRGADADFFVGNGAGTLCDLAKYAGDVHKRPALLYPTAASMNGYTSSIVALKVRGLKRTLPCAPAIGVFADPQVVATAPPRMTAAGVGDFLSKASSSADWRASNILRGCYFCHRPREFSEEVQGRILDMAPRIGQGDPEAIGVVLEGLMLTGLGMVVAGSSAPASGGEHLISHYLDMKRALYHTTNDLHGAQVGVGTIYALELWERVLELDPAGIDVDALVAQHPTENEIHAWIEADWGSVADEVQAQWNQKSLGPDGLRAELERFRQQLPELREALAEDLLPSKVVAEAIRLSGGPVTPEELHAPVEEYRKAQQRARFLRNRFTVLDLAAELGLA